MSDDVEAPWPHFSDVSVLIGRTFGGIHRSESVCRHHIRSVPIKLLLFVSLASNEVTSATLPSLLILLMDTHS